MKKIFLLTLFGFIFLLAFKSVSFAQVFDSEAQTRGESSQSATATSSSTQIDYQLPYPGLLPDSPFYFLKVVRDKVVSFLISDPIKKAEFDLLTADKRLGAGFYLINNGSGKEELAISTISKGENYFEEAVAKVEEAKKQGMGVKDISQKILLSAKKHKEVLKTLEKKISKEKQSLIDLEKRVDGFEKRVKLFTTE